MSKRRRIITTAVSALIWLLLWELFAYLLDIKFIFPGAIETFKAFSALIFTTKFWITVLLSIFRILLGLLLGILFGIILGAVSISLPSVSVFISCGMTVIRSTPVASVIMLLWVILDNASFTLPVMIALLMVMPIIWQSITDGYKDIDHDLDEVAAVFGFSFLKRMKLVVLPTLIRYLLPAALTAVGFAWKSGISAEIIAYTKNSIGQYIHDAKVYFEGDVLLSWTLAVVVLSLIFEFSVKALARRIKIYEPHA